MITTTTINHFGTDHTYIDDPTTAELVQQLTGKKTINNKDKKRCILFDVNNILGVLARHV